ncbi:LysR family transcriptional regulator [uncultured Pseudacidovorax sp.]|uniref:LysR family transcriptional regulator n=1 Tax=uncultured Pseudacidovorax sp. TaxID=679313 RepID=UPI0025F8BB2E|nr:LysR family transcriptional regulator [uncultured Pseudacidovorax sp.]
MTLKQLEAFYWAATCASFALAAERLHLSVSSLSKRLAELESALGAPLFDRAGHRARLSEAGQRLLPLAADLLQRAEQARMAVGPGATLSGIVHLGTGELASMTWLARAVAWLRARHPAMELRIEVDIGAHLARRVEQAELDAAVISGAASRPTLSAVPLGQAAFVWCASAALAAGVERLDAESWSRHTLVALPRGSGVTQLQDGWMARAGARPRAVLICSQWGAVASLLAAGQGIGMLPRGLADGLVQRGVLCRLSATEPLATLDYGFHFRHGDPRPLVAALRQACLETADFDAPGPFF